jgi:hypothetical protein
MNGLIFLVIMILMYHIIDKYVELSTKTHFYVSSSLILYSIFIFLYYFFPEYIYKAFKEIYNTHQKPLYDYNHFAKNKREDISYKQLMHSKQGGRCYKCVNFILGNEVEKSYLDVKNQNEKVDINNMSLLCPNCYSKSRII